MEIRVDNLNTIHKGSNFLGSGGGIESLHAKTIVAYQLKKRNLSIVELDSLKDDDLIATMIIFGSPVAESERNYNLGHFEQLIRQTNKNLGKQIAAIAPISVGGGTLFVPLSVAACLNIPVVDADCIGRCFPELQMISTHIAGIGTKTSFITNTMGGFFTIESRNFHALEYHIRQVTKSSGGLCLVIPQVLTGEEAKRGLIPGTLTQALTIGQIIQEKRSLRAVMDHTGGTFVGIGGITFAEGSLKLPKPFRRRIVIQNQERGLVWEVFQRNEFDMLFENGKCIAEVPDIITICDPYTCEPLTTNQLKLNANVAICTMKAPDVWYTEKGLELTRSQEHTKGKDILLCESASASRRIV